ncbi:hypothetical protein K1W69_20910 [Hoeflea sp. WL0058]|uniref:Chromosomal replication initiator protein DnaA domain-containing protein n=1 Tax=Flavimaribacter sediminis TaxID=2865987 RepID=A0AAE3D2Y2_9HYPH|nr:DnaA regulatory inactivator HdaA [Flavimaribacter sediminis]MBW8639667.1 hypothetical protein [Flavimaribacter sediminis]
MSRSDHTSADRPNDQLPLGFAHDASTSRDDLVVSDPVSQAIRLIDDWPAWPSPVTILAGPTGSGKTHLANIWRDRACAVEITVRSGEENNLKSAESGPVLIEDIDRTGFDQTLLFHLINTVLQHRTSLLVTSRIWPAGWPLDLPDLRSRLKAATVVEIGEPDDELLARVIVKLFADRQLGVDEKVVSYLVNRMERSLDAAQLIVHRMDNLALSRGSRINRRIAADVLQELEDRDHHEDVL